MDPNTPTVPAPAASPVAPAAPPAKTAAPPPAPRAVPKWESDARERVRAALRKYTKPLTDLAARDANEGDTRLLVTDFLCEALGYDKYADLSTEYLVRGEFADYGLRIDKDLVAFIEVKRVATKLDTKHLRQVEQYAVNEGVEWVILTNAQQWKVYHITVATGQAAIIDLALDVSLLGETSPQARANGLYYLTREAMKRNLISDLWKAKRAIAPKSLAKILLTPAVITAIQTELRRQTGYRADPAELTQAIRQTVIRAECFEKS